MEVHIVQGAVIKTMPKTKKCKKAKWFSEEALQIAEKTREAKGKGEKERYLNAEFKRIARRDKKAFLTDQCKEIEEKISAPVSRLISACQLLDHCPLSRLKSANAAAR